MKSIRLLLVTLFVLSLNSSCDAQTGKEVKTPKISKSDNVQVYYFHLTSRCVTCKAIETVASEAVAGNYGGEVSFTAYNIEEPEGEKKGKELGVSGQALLIVGGDQKINLTNEAFMYARTNPEKFKELIKEKVDPILK
ncbi:MAG TPA: hypothetical protein ENH59_06560 [Bacteroidetes bacterium]|nr:hypothetical protein [Bacteroidota bacterium]